MTFCLWRSVIVLMSATVFCTVAAFSQAIIHVPADQPTIQAGINAANNGDTVLVDPGTYNENIDFKGKAITVTSGATTYSGATSTIISGTANGPVVVFQTNEPPSSVLNGFTIQNGHYEGTMANPGNNGGGISISQASPSITNNIVANNFGCGVLVFNLASPLIQGNDIKRTSQDPNTYSSFCIPSPIPPGYAGVFPGTGLGIFDAGNVQVIENVIEENGSGDGSNAGCGPGVSIISSTQVLLKNNIIRNNVANCSSGLIAIYEFEFGSDSLVMVQNLIYGNVYPGFNIAQVSLTGGAGSGSTRVISPPFLTEINNTIYGGGQEIDLNFAAAIIENNIFVNTNQLPSGQPDFGDFYSALVCEGFASSAPVFSHNDIFNIGTLQPTNCPSGTGNLSADPQFLNPAAYDFHTQPTSPVVAAGDINAPQIPSADLDNKARTVCGTIDMGVYEVRPHPPIALQASANPIVGGNSVTFTATLTGNCNVPTGTVTFFDGTTVLGTVVLNGSASASLVAPSLFVGTHNITVTYPGDFNFENSTSNTVVEVVTGYPTTTGLSVTPNPADAFQAITLTATVSSAFGTPTGTVTFLSGSNVLGTATLNGSGVASTTVSTLGAGSYSITASYGGSTDFATSTSAPVLEVVVGANTTTSLLASPNPVIFDQTLTLTATVTATQGNGVPTGSITFLDGTQTLGSATLSTKGIAVFTTSSLALGTHSITASYAGSSNANASISNLVSVVVIPIPASIGLTGTPNPANFGQTVTFTASVAAAGTPSGTVTFFDQGTTLGSVALNASGVASFATSTLLAGTHQITATFNPSGPYGATTSAPLSETILDYDFSLSVSTTSLTIPGGGYQILSVTVTPIGGFPGTVALGCSTLPVHTLCNFKPSTTPLLSNGAQTVQFTLNTSDVLGYGQKVGALTVPGFPSSHNGSLRFAGVLFPLMMLGGFAGAASRRSNSTLRRLLLVVAIACLSLNLAACSGKLPGVTPPGTYTVTVNGTDTDPTSNIVHSVNLQLTVTP